MCPLAPNMESYNFVPRFLHGELIFLNDPPRVNDVRPFDYCVLCTTQFSMSSLQVNDFLSITDPFSCYYNYKLVIYCAKIGILGYFLVSPGVKMTEHLLDAVKMIL